MGFEIEDGRGRGFKASVSETNRLNVSSKIAPRSFYVSRDDGLTFMLNSVDTDAVAGDYILYLKNNSTTKNLFIEQFHVGAANAALWKVWVVTGTAAGSDVITATNINLSSGRTADIIARGNGAITGLTTSSLITTRRHPITGHEHAILDAALILGPNNAIAVEYDTGTTGAAEIEMQFHFEEIGRKN